MKPSDVRALEEALESVRKGGAEVIAMQEVRFQQIADSAAAAVEDAKAARLYWNASIDKFIDRVRQLEQEGESYAE